MLLFSHFLTRGFKKASKSIHSVILKNASLRQKGISAFSKVGRPELRVSHLADLLVELLNGDEELPVVDPDGVHVLQDAVVNVHDGSLPVSDSAGEGKRMTVTVYRLHLYLL